MKDLKVQMDEVDFFKLAYIEEVEKRKMLELEILRRELAQTKTQLAQKYSSDGKYQILSVDPATRELTLRPAGEE